MLYLDVLCNLRMKPLIIIFCVFALHFSSYSQSNADSGVAAIGLVVSDIDNSEKFYKDILGMKEVGGFSLDEPWSKEAGAANGKPFSVKLFKMKDLSSATVLKLAYFEKTERSSDKQGIDINSGVNYITLYYSAEEFQQVIGRIDAKDNQKIGLG